MAEEIVKQTVGEGTEVQVTISMEPLTNLDGEELSLSDLDWSCSFEGNKDKFDVLKADAFLIDDNSYECIVDTSVTGKTADMKAVLTITNIPTINNKTRKEVTPPISLNLEVV
jgi:hypothetical protein